MRILAADAAYDSRALRQFLLGRGTTPEIPNNPIRKHHQPFNRSLYRRRNFVERSFLLPEGFPPRRHALRQARQHLRRRRLPRRHRHLVVVVRNLRLDPVGFSGHSLRRGLLTNAGDRQLPLIDLMRQSRHRSVDIALSYAEAGDA